MLEISPKAYAVLVVVLCLFLISTGAVYVGLLTWMTMNSVEATGTAFQRLELFICTNLGLLIGCIFKPNK